MREERETQPIFQFPPLKTDAHLSLNLLGCDSHYSATQGSEVKRMKRQIKKKKEDTESGVGFKGMKEKMQGPQWLLA